VKGSDAFSWYRLFRAEGFGPKAVQTLWDAVQKGKCALEDLFTMSSSEFEDRFPTLGKGALNRASFQSLHTHDEGNLFEEYQSFSDTNIELVHPGHPLFPESLLRLAEHGVPLIVFCKGMLSLMKSPGVAIVGSRNASDEGIRIARQLAGDLASNGENVISGYAKGIDTAAHSGALDEEGTTTIVLSQGILHFSRKKKTFSNLDLARNTLVVSQFHPSSRWNPANAMMRNRLVCALSKAVIVVESGPEIGEDGSVSGTFNAGIGALEMRIPLFVVSPGALKKPPPGNKSLMSRGGIEIEPDSGIQRVLRNLKTTRRQQENVVATGEQLTLF
jgi:DNA protecting protein DprA